MICGVLPRISSLLVILCGRSAVRFRFLRIDELCEERLYRMGGEGFDGNFVWLQYSSYTTMNPMG